MNIFVEQGTFDDTGIVEVLLDLEGDPVPEGITLPDGTRLKLEPSDSIQDVDGNPLYVVSGIIGDNE